MCYLWDNYPVSFFFNLLLTNLLIISCLRGLPSSDLCSWLLCKLHAHFHEVFICGFSRLFHGLNVCFYFSSTLFWLLSFCVVVQGQAMWYHPSSFTQVLWLFGRICSSKQMLLIFGLYLKYATEVLNKIVLSLYNSPHGMDHFKIFILLIYDHEMFSIFFVFFFLLVVIFLISFLSPLLICRYLIFGGDTFENEVYLLFQTIWIQMQQIVVYWFCRLASYWFLLSFFPFSFFLLFLSHTPQCESFKGHS